MAILYFVLVAFWIYTFLLLFTEEKPPKFAVGCAYLIVITAFLKEGISLVIN